MNDRIRGLYKRGRIYWLTYRVSGKKHYVTLETSDYVEAVARAARILKDPSLTAASTLQADMERFLAHKLANSLFTRATARSQRSVLHIFGEAMNWASVTDIRPEDIQMFYNQKLQTIAPGSALTYVMTLRSFFKWCVAQRLIRSNPVVGVQLARVASPARQRFCTFEERDRLILHAPTPDLGFVLHAGFFAGLRLNEIIQARPDWFDLASGVCHVRKTDSFCPKNREERTIPLCREFKGFLASYGHPSPFMLKPDVKQRRGPYRYDFRVPFQKYLAVQGMPWVTPHVMRHTFASLLASRGCNIYKIAKWLGDGLDTTQKHYAHLLPADEDIELSGSSPRSSLAAQPVIDFSV